jgi:hypothetical protein
MTRLLFLCLFFPSLLFSQVNGDFHSKLYFEENAGQAVLIADKYPGSIQTIYFVLKGKELTYYFSDRGYSVVQKNEDGITNRTDFLFQHDRVCFVPEYTRIIPEGENENSSNAKYYLSGKTISPRQFQKIIYRDVQNRGDVEFSVHGDSLERKLIIHDHSWLGGIAFDVYGSKVDGIDRTKGYLFSSEAGTFSETCNQKSADAVILFPYELGNGEARMNENEIGAYIFHNEATAISTISWLTYIGGNSADEFFGIQVTADSGAVVVGRTASLDFPVTVGAQQDTMAGNYDVAIIRFASNGNCLWSTYYGGTNFDGAYQVIAIDSIFAICGMTNSTDLPMMNATQLANGGSYDAFILVLDSAGNELRSTYYGGTGGDQAFTIAKGPANEIVLGGSSSSTDLPSANLGFQGTLGGQIDAFLSVFDLNLNLQWSTYYGGPQAEDIHGMCVTPQGEIAFVGSTRSNNFSVTANAWQSGMLVAPDNYLVKFGMNGTRHYATFFGGSNNEDANAVVSDAAGNLYMTGFTYSTDFPTQGIIFQPTILGQNDAFVSKFDSTGQLVWSTFVGGGGQDVAWGMYGSGKYIYVCGETASNNFPVSPNAIQSTWAAISDGFVIKMDTTGQMVSGTFMGGNGYDGLLALTVTADTSVITTGDTYSSNLPVTVNAFQMTNHFNGDGYVVKFGMSEELISTNVISLNENNEIKVFPNPSSDFVTISSTDKTISRIEILDVSGRLIKNIAANSFEVKVDVSDLSNGIYFLRVEDENNVGKVFRVIRN